MSNIVHSCFIFSSMFVLGQIDQWLKFCRWPFEIRTKREFPLQLSGRKKGKLMVSYNVFMSLFCQLIMASQSLCEVFFLVILGTSLLCLYTRVANFLGSLLIVVRLQEKLKEALSAPVETLLDGANNDTWSSIRKLLNRETLSAVSGFSAELDRYDMDEETKKSMIVTLEDYAKGVIEARAREEASRVLIRMKDRYEPHAKLTY